MWQLKVEFTQVKRLCSMLGFGWNDVRMLVIAADKPWNKLMKVCSWTGSLESTLITFITEGPICREMEGDPVSHPQWNAFSCWWGDCYQVWRIPGGRPTHTQVISVGHLEGVLNSTGWAFSISGVHNPSPHATWTRHGVTLAHPAYPLLIPM